uniref:Uncharacterized protein n=1 Tax=Arundo donax TaxID=35708 RepID=A0A0A9H8V9_ARUDO
MRPGKFPRHQFLEILPSLSIRSSRRGQIQLNPRPLKKCKINCY